MANFEEDYLDVLQKIEFAIVSVYREQPGLLDYEVEKALELLIRSYEAESQQRSFSAAALPPVPQSIYERVRSMCDWRLGRAGPPNSVANAGGPLLGSLSLAEIVACLKRIRKSLQKWSKREGRQGYVRFVSEFVK